MNSNINPKIVLEHIDKFLKELEEINKLPYNEGSKELRTLNRGIEGLLKATFEDHENRIGELHWAYASAGKEEEKRHFLIIKIAERYLLSLKQELNFINTLKDTQSDTNNDKTSKSNVTQIFHGDIENFASRDIYNYTTTIYLNALIKAIEESENIPEEDKKSLIDKIKDVANNQYVAGISSSLIVEGIKAISMGFKPF